MRVNISKIKKHFHRAVKILSNDFHDRNSIEGVTASLLLHRTVDSKQDILSVKDLDTDRVFTNTELSC